jgi:hypothetical protein
MCKTDDENVDRKASDLTTGTKKDRYCSAVSNQDLVEGAGQVHLDKGEPWGRGIWIDVKRTVGSHWVSEVTKFNQKTVGVTLLLFISVIAPTLAFGSAYSKATNNNVGAIETMLGTAYVGMVYALVGGMPMVRGGRLRALCESDTN